MALQDLAQSPFRVVDEINQGMDPRNERMVHERMVDIACQERTSQYFLVTPKLLEGLKFHPKMKVHVINSGEHVPAANQATGNWNMTDWAKIAMKTRKGVTVA
jgi:chromosome segregation ATPase